MKAAKPVAPTRAGDPANKVSHQIRGQLGSLQLACREVVGPAAVVRAPGVALHGPWPVGGSVRQVQVAQSVHAHAWTDSAGRGWLLGAQPCSGLKHPVHDNDSIRCSMLAVPRAR